MVTLMLESDTATRSFPGETPDPTNLVLNSLFVGIMRTTMKRAEAFAGTLDLTPARVAVVSILHRTPERRLTVGEIAAGLHVSSTNISRRLDGLEADGWVRREPNPADARSVYVTLTEEGLQRANEAMPAIYRRMNVVWSCFSAKEKSDLIDYLGRFLEHVQTAPELGVHASV